MLSTRDLLTRIFGTRIVHCPCRKYGTFEDRGRCSAIPACCRRWFVDVWYRLDLDVKLQRNERWSQHDGWGWGYIACPGCRQCGARVRVRRCQARPLGTGPESMR